MRRHRSRVILGTMMVTMLLGSAAPTLAQGCDPLETEVPLGWTPRTPMPLTRIGAAGVMIGDKIYVTHGAGPPGGVQNSTFIYNRNTDTWSSGAAAGFSRSDLTGVCVENTSGQGLVLALGGNSSTQPLPFVEAYNAATNTWTTKAFMPTPRRGLGAAYVPGFGIAGGTLGTVYAFGGSNGTAMHGGVPLAVNEAYDVEGDSWMTMAPMPIPMMDIYSTVFFPDTGLIYIIGGFDGVAPSSVVQIYDPQADIWTLGSPMRTPRSNLLSGICGPKIYAIGGFNGGYLDVNEVYDPFLDRWAPVPEPPLPVAVVGLATQSMYTQREIYIIGATDVPARPPMMAVFSCGAVPLCFNAPIPELPPGPVADTMAVTHDRPTGITSLNWPVEVGVASYNTYRGTIPSSLMGRRLPGGSTDPYDHVCLESDDTAGDGPTVTKDGALPAPGTAYYYLISGENAACGDGTLGTRSNGLPRPNPAPCPTPP